MWDKLNPLFFHISEHYFLRLNNMSSVRINHTSLWLYVFKVAEKLWDLKVRVHLMSTFGFRKSELSSICFLINHSLSYKTACLIMWTNRVFRILCRLAKRGGSGYQGWIDPQRVGQLFSFNLGTLKMSVYNIVIVSYMYVSTFV